MMTPDEIATTGLDSAEINADADHYYWQHFGTAEDQVHTEDTLIAAVHGVLARHMELNPTFRLSVVLSPKVAGDMAASTLLSQP